MHIIPTEIRSAVDRCIYPQGISEIFRMFHPLQIDRRDIGGTVAVIGPESNFFDRALLCSPPFFDRLDRRVDKCLISDNDLSCRFNWLVRGNRLFREHVDIRRCFDIERGDRVQFVFTDFLNACTQVAVPSFDIILCLRQYDLSSLLSAYSQLILRVLKPTGQFIVTGGISESIPSGYFIDRIEPIHESYFSRYKGEHIGAVLKVLK